MSGVTADDVADDNDNDIDDADDDDDDVNDDDDETDDDDDDGLVVDCTFRDVFLCDSFFDLASV